MSQDNKTKENRPKNLLIQVTEEGNHKPDVRIPFSLVKIGLKFGKKFAGLGGRNQKGTDGMEYLEDVEWDEILEALDNGENTLPFLLVDVEDQEKGLKVKITLE